MSASITPLKYLAPGWFSIVMGLCGLALAWHAATGVLGDTAGAGAWALGGVAALVFVVLALASVLRWQRYPEALLEDMRHPVRHVFLAALPVSLILLATVATALAGPVPTVRLLWMAGALGQMLVTVRVLSRWLDPSVGGSKPGASFWAGITPLLFIPVVGNVLVPLAGVTLGFGAWSAAQFGVGLLMWPVVLALLLVRIGVAGLWAERLLPTTFITIAPAAVGGLAALQMGAPVLVGWMAWGVALLFLAWSAAVFKRCISQPFALTFWAMSFPLAAFSALTLRLALEAPGWFRGMAMAWLALSSLVVAALVLATVRGLRSGTLLAPEPLAMLSSVGVSAPGVSP